MPRPAARLAGRILLPVCFLIEPGWGPGVKNKVNRPIIHNLRRDPFKRYADPNFAVGSPNWFIEFYAHEFWRFVFVQGNVAELAKTAIEFPPMPKDSSFNLEAVKERIQEAISADHGG